MEGFVEKCVGLLDFFLFFLAGVEEKRG